MPCYHPLTAWRSEKRGETGKRQLSFSRKNCGAHSEQLKLACGRCIGCRLERSRQWATRCVHEASLYPENSFITLTFRNACPLDGTRSDPTETLHKHHFQRFMKRLRKHFYGNQKANIRYFHCGEYGDNLGRPHHHACLFNLSFADKTLWSVRDGVRLYRSKTLENLWPYGASTVGDVTFESAAYVARYVVKKITGSLAEKHYGKKLPEYCTMSRRPGLGQGWLTKYADDVFPKDFIVIRGKKSKVPKYYSGKYELTNSNEFRIIKADRIYKQRGNPNNDPDRMIAAEIIHKAQAAQLHRTLNGD